MFDAVAGVALFKMAQWLAAAGLAATVAWMTRRATENGNREMGGENGNREMAVGAVSGLDVGVEGRWWDRVPAEVERGGPEEREGTTVQRLDLSPRSDETYLRGLEGVIFRDADSSAFPEDWNAFARWSWANRVWISGKYRGLIGAITPEGIIRAIDFGPNPAIHYAHPWVHPNTIRSKLIYAYDPNPIVIDRTFGPWSLQFDDGPAEEVDRCLFECAATHLPPPLLRLVGEYVGATVFTLATHSNIATHASLQDWFLCGRRCQSIDDLKTGILAPYTPMHISKPPRGCSGPTGMAL